MCTICCWYLLNSKPWVVFSYLHSFTLSDSVFTSANSGKGQSPFPRLEELQEGAGGSPGSQYHQDCVTLGQLSRHSWCPQPPSGTHSPSWHPPAPSPASPAQLPPQGCGTSSAAPAKHQGCTFKYIDFFSPLNASSPWLML